MLHGGQLAAASHPQFTTAILRQLRHAVVVRQRAGRTVADADQCALLVQHPDVAVLIRADGGDFPPHARFVDILRFKFSAAITRQVAAFMADPQGSFCVLKQAGDPVALQRRCARAVEHREMRAVKPRQAAVGAGPKITVPRLHHRRHRVVRQAVLRLPRTRKIIRQISFFRARHETEAAEQQRENFAETLRAGRAPRQKMCR